MSVEPLSRVEMLEAENDSLRERIANLEREFMGTDFNFPVEWRLTGSEKRAFGVLLLRQMATKAMIMSALYSDGIREEAEIKIVDVFICKDPEEARWGMGYAIDEPLRSDLRREVDPEQGRFPPNSLRITNGMGLS